MDLSAKNPTTLVYSTTVLCTGECRKVKNLLNMTVTLVVSFFSSMPALATRTLLCRSPFLKKYNVGLR